MFCVYTADKSLFARLCSQNNSPDVELKALLQDCMDSSFPVPAGSGLGFQIRQGGVGFGSWPPNQKSGFKKCTFTNICLKWGVSEWFEAVKVEFSTLVCLDLLTKLLDGHHHNQSFPPSFPE